MVRHEHSVKNIQADDTKVQKSRILTALASAGARMDLYADLPLAKGASSAALDADGKVKTSGTSGTRSCSPLASRLLCWRVHQSLTFGLCVCVWKMKYCNSMEDNDGAGVCAAGDAKHRKRTAGRTRQSDAASYQHKERKQRTLMDFDYSVSGNSFAVCTLPCFGLQDREYAPCGIAIQESACSGSSTSFTCSCITSCEEAFRDLARV